MLLLVFIGLKPLTGQDSTNFVVSLNYYNDFSDTFGGGKVFSGEVCFVRTWYGAGLNYGHFLSNYSYLYEVPIDGSSKSIGIPIQEMANMEVCSFSSLLRPVSGKSLYVDVIIGFSLAKSKSFYLSELAYSYDVSTSKFNYLSKNYNMIIRKHFGYQVGLDFSFLITRNFGLKISSRIHDLNNGGSFFYMGGGVMFVI